MPAGNRYTTGPNYDILTVVQDFQPKLEAALETIWIRPISFLNNLDPEDTGGDRVSYNWLGQVGQMRKWVGGRQERTLNKYSLSIQHFPYENTLPISVEDLRRRSILRGKIGDMGVRAATHWNQIGADLINAGEAGTMGLGYDGTFLWATDHNESGTAQSNDLTATEIPSANCADPNVPTTTEAANIINEVLSYAMTLKDDQGEPINQSALSVTIMVSKHTHRSAFIGAIMLNNLTQATDNPVRALKSLGYQIKVEFTPRATAENKIKFFIDADGTSAALILQEEGGVETQLQGEGSHDEFWNNRHVFGVKAIRGAGYGLWQKTILVALS